MSHDHHNHHNHNNDQDLNTPSSVTTILANVANMLTSTAAAEVAVHDPQHHAHQAVVASAVGTNADPHAGHSMGSMGMMDMSFHFGYNELILFKFWQINTVGGLIGSMIGIFLMAMLYEGLKVLREFLLQRSLQNETSLVSRQNGSSSSSGLRVPLAGEIDSVQDSQNVILVKSYFRPNPLSVPHAVQTILHMLQMFVSYLLMLIFMTFNVWLCLAVILGGGAGYFTFGWRKRTIVDINEHCH